MPRRSAVNTLLKEFLTTETINLKSTTSELDNQVLLLSNAISANDPILEDNLLDIVQIQQALVAGTDPTNIAQATAAGTPESNPSVLVHDDADGGHISIPIIYRDGHETIAVNGPHMQEVQLGLMKPDPVESGGSIEYDAGILEKTVTPVVSTFQDSTEINIGKATANTDNINNSTPVPNIPNTDKTDDNSSEPNIPNGDLTLTIWLKSVTSSSLFKTGFESITPQEKVFIDSIEGWHAPVNGKIEPWREYNSNETPKAYGYGKYKAHSGSNFIELNAKQTHDQYTGLDDASSISRIVNTKLGALYEFSFYYSPRPGFNQSVTEIEVVWGGKVIATISIDGSDLDNNQWHLFKYTLIGDGLNTTLELRHSGDYEGGGRGAFIDDLQLTELTGGGVAVGYQSSMIDLPDFAIQLTDPSDQDKIQVFLRHVPLGVTITDGQRSVEVGESDVDITGWSYDSLALIPTNNVVGHFDLNVDVIAKSNQSSLAQQALRVQILADDDVSTAVDSYLIAGSGQDIFTFAQDDQNHSSEADVDVIVGFDVEQDVLNIHDLLTDTDNTLEQYLDFNFSISDTTISISLVANNNVQQNIVLKNVNLSEYYGTSNEMELINQLLLDEVLVV